MTSEMQCFFKIAFLLSVASCRTCASMDLSKIHENMTDDELFAIFHVKDRTAVPEYEVVPVTIEQNTYRSRRSPPHNKRGHYSVTIKDLQLYLEPVDHVLLSENTPVYLASGDESYPLGIRYKFIRKPWPSNFSLYQDAANNAAAAIFKKPDGQVNIEGIIGNDVIIKPLPSRLRNSTRYSYVTYKKNRDKRPLNAESYFEKSYWSSKPGPHEAQTKVDVVYPEILVIADYETYLAHGKNLQALTRYMAVFWNAVDLRFRAMTKPEVRLNIAGLIVATEAAGAPYMARHREGKERLRIMQTALELGKYLHGERRFNNTYDLTVAMTNLDLCMVKSDYCTQSPLGISRVRGACMHNEDSSDSAVAVMEDHAGFDGLLTAAHEVGHLLGAEHDGEKTYLGLATGRCDRNFLMARSVVGSSNSLLWSDCSIILMNHFLGTRRAACLRNKPQLKKPIPKVLPGQLLSRSEQCRIRHSMVDCKGHFGDECRALYCRKPVGKFNNKCVSTEPPAEGSPCSGGGMCLDGVCIHQEEENNDVSENI